jgi:glycosyltransferase involved in cell wall biosynthesis
MRVAVVFNSPTRIADSSIRYERYVRGFRALGHDAALVTTRASAEGAAWVDVAVPDAGSLHDPGLWRELRADAVVLPTWLGMAELLEKVRPHARWIVGLADSDGRVGARVHPWALAVRMWSFHRRLSDRLRAAFWLARQYGGAYRQVDAPVLASARLCDRVVVCSEGARGNLAAFFRYHREPELAARLHVAPYPVDESFDELAVSAERRRQVVAIGRWEDPQKAVPFLARLIGRYLGRGDDARFVLLGSGGEDHFRGCVARRPDRVEYRGVVPPAEVTRVLDESQVLLSTSLWESGPIIAAEALLRGCSLVGPRSVPLLDELAREGGGTTFASRSAAVAALEAELAAWSAGRRDPLEIARRWRGQFTPAAVCDRLLDGLAEARPIPAREEWSRR